MTARGRVNSSADWDPMRDDYNDTTYDAQYQDNEASSARSTQSFPLDHRKLYITNIPPGLSEQGLKTAFDKYGQVEQAFLSRDPTKKYALIRYETAAEARVAMMKLNRTEPLNLHVNLAHAKGNNSEGQNGTRDRRNRDSGSVSSRDRRSRLPKNEEKKIGYELHSKFKSIYRNSKYMMKLIKPTHHNLARGPPPLLPHGTRSA